MDFIKEEITLECTENNRPVIVVFDKSERMDEFTKWCPYSQTIKTINDKTELMISKIGLKGSLTFITASILKGITFTMEKEALANGGLHMIIPYWLNSQRLLEQVVGMVGRGGNQGSVSIYTSVEDKFVEQQGFNETFDNLIWMQTQFSKDLQENYKWIFGKKSDTKIIEQYPLECHGSKQWIY